MTRMLCPVSNSGSGGERCVDVYNIQLSAEQVIQYRSDQTDAGSSVRTGTTPTVDRRSVLKIAEVGGGRSFKWKEETS